MKQNLQPPSTPLEMLSLFLPAGLLDYFDLVNHVSQETCFIFFLEEKPSIPQEHSHLQAQFENLGELVKMAIFDA